MNFLTGQMSRSTKTIIFIMGIVLLLPGLMIALANLCIVPFAILSSPRTALGPATASFVLLALTLGAGGVVTWHAARSLQGKPSKPLRLPPVWIVAGIFGLMLVVGIVSRTNATLAAFVFPPALLITAAIPPLFAVAWFAHPERSRRMPTDGLTFRRGMVAFAGGATVSVAIAIVLEILLPVIILSLVFNLSNVALKSVQNLLADLAGQQIARAIANPGFIYSFIQLAIIAPIAEEIAKPLITLPLIGRLARRDAFLVAAMAGAGFAALENVIYTSFGMYLWSGILIVRAIGGAIHPLGAGLVGLSWRDWLNGERNWHEGLARFGIAVGMHALWNGGSLFVVTLAGAQFFGKLPSGVNILGLSTAGVVLALLIVLGLAALWLGRTTAQQARGETEIEIVDTSFALSDRHMAIWALVCLVTVVPMGVTALRLLLR
ncbi:MAG: PrsW family intramembrane metalloprotease [Chloroflexi bacterium]|nr:PrsW family intramembrane metalloprotease [Chloroflexota bacterium]